jgi:hypothetical protein
MLIRNKIKDNQKKKKLNVRWKESRMMIMKIKHDLNIWIKSLYEVEKSTRYHVNDLKSWVERRTNEKWSTIQLINEFISQDRNTNESDENQLMIIIQAIDENDSFRASLTIEVQREAMIFASYSDQRALLLWEWRSFWKYRFCRLKMSSYKLFKRRVCFNFIHARSENYSSLKQSIIFIKAFFISTFHLFYIYLKLMTNRYFWKISFDLLYINNRVLFFILSFFFLLSFFFITESDHD